MPIVCLVQWANTVTQMYKSGPVHTAHQTEHQCMLVYSAEVP